MAKADVASNEKKKVTLHRKGVRYKKFSMPGAGGSIHALLTAALANMQSPTSRFRTIEGIAPDAPAEKIGLNRWWHEGQTLCAQFVLYTAGRNAPAIEEADGVQFYNVHSVEPKKGLQYVDSMGYLAVVDDHVMFCGTSAIRSGDLERYLQWFLVEAGVATDKSPMILQDAQPTSARAEIKKKGGVRKVELAGPVSLVEQKGGRLGAGTVSMEIDDTGMGPIVKAMGSTLAGRIALPSESDIERLRATLVISFYRKKILGPSEAEFLQTVMDATRNYPDDDVTVHLKNGTLKGSDMRVHKGLPVGRPTGEVDEVVFGAECAKWLLELIQQKVV